MLNERMWGGRRSQIREGRRQVWDAGEERLFSASVASSRPFIVVELGGREELKNNNNIGKQKNKII